MTKARVTFKFDTLAPDELAALAHAASTNVGQRGLCSVHPDGTVYPAGAAVRSMSGETLPVSETYDIAAMLQAVAKVFGVTGPMDAEAERAAIRDPDLPWPGSWTDAVQKATAAVAAVKRQVDDDEGTDGRVVTALDHALDAWDEFLRIEQQVEREAERGDDVLEQERIESAGDPA